MQRPTSTLPLAVDCTSFRARDEIPFEKCSKGAGAMTCCITIMLTLSYAKTLVLEYSFLPYEITTNSRAACALLAASLRGCIFRSVADARPGAATKSAAGDDFR